MRKILFGLLGLLFTIPSWGALPSDYTKLEYIESTGTQYIKLPPFPNASNINVTADVLQTNGTDEQIFFAIDSVQTLYTSGENWRVWRANAGSFLLANTSSRHSFDIKTTRSGVKYYIDGVQNTNVLETVYTSELFSERILFLGARTATTTGADYFWQGRIYSFNSECDGVVCMNLVPAKRNSDGAIGMYDTVGERFYENAGSGSFIAGPIAEIKVATTKYVESEFAPMVSALQSAISVVDSVVSNTITQAASIATLQSGKQTRPADDTCPAYKQCLLVEDEQGVPHWYQITDPFRDFVTPIIANNVNGASRGFYRGYTQLEYIESTGTQWIDTGVSVNNRNSFEIQYKGLSGGYLVSQGTNSLRITASQVSWFSDHYHFVANPSADDFHIIDFGYDYMKVDGVNITGSTDHDNTSGTSVFLFAKNSSDNNSSAQVKYFKIYDASGTLVRNFIPVVNNKTGTIGMYDTVGGQFYGNAATSGADFTPGPIVDNDADVPGDSWAVTWTANATTGVSAGTVRGTTRCTAANATPGTGTAWNTLETGTGVSCWCIVSGVNVDGTGTVASELMARFYGSYGKLIDCSFNCPVFCADAVKDQNTFRKGLFGM